MGVEEVEKHISEVSGVESVTVNFAAENAKVRYDETRLDVADIKSAVRQRSYESFAQEHSADKPAEEKDEAPATPPSIKPKEEKDKPETKSTAIVEKNEEDSSGMDHSKMDHSKLHHIKIIQRGLKKMNFTREHTDDTLNTARSFP